MERLLKISNGMDKVATVITFLAIAGYIVVMFLQVVLRNLAPEYALPWADGVCRYCFIWGSFMGAALAVKRRQHIAITVVTDSLKGIPKIISTLFIALMFLVVLTITFVIGLKGIQLTSVQKADSLPIAAAWIYAAIPTGALFSIFQLVATTLEDLFSRKQSDLEGKELAQL